MAAPVDKVPVPAEGRVSPPSPNLRSNLSILTLSRSIGPAPSTCARFAGQSPTPRPPRRVCVRATHFTFPRCCALASTCLISAHALS